MYQSHIEQTINLFNKIRKQDITIYSQIVVNLLFLKGVQCVDDLKIYFELLDIKRNSLTSNFPIEKVNFSLDEKKNIKLSNSNLEIETQSESEDDSKESNSDLFFDIKNFSIESFFEQIKDIREKNKLINEKNENEREKTKLFLESDEAKEKKDIINNLIKIASQNGIDTNYNDIIPPLSAELFYHFAKSLLNAEYLFLSNYSSLLKEIELKLTNLDSEPSHKIEISPYTLKSFVKTSWHAIEACEIIKKQIEHPQAKLVYIPTDRERKLLSLPLFGSSNFAGKDGAILYEEFMESLINVTIIDHCYQSTKYNIEQLLICLDRCSLLEREMDALTNDIKEPFKLLIKTVKTKASTLLYQILEQDDKYNIEDGIYSYETQAVVNGESNLIRIKDKIKEYVIEQEEVQNPILKIKRDHKNEKVEIKKYEILKKTLNDCVDIEKYDKHIEKSIKEYSDYSSYYFSNSDKENVIGEKIDDFIKEQYNTEKGKTIPLSFLLKLIKNIHNQLEQLLKTDKITHEELEKIKGKLSLLKELLIKLRFEALKYKDNYNVPLQFKPYFQHSFYLLNNKDQNVSYKSNNKDSSYSVEEYVDSFFFASLDCAPLNPDYIKSFYDYFHANRKKLSDMYYDMINKRLDETIIKAEKIDDKIDKGTQNTITILGIFAAFLAFTTGGIGFIKIANSMLDFILYSATFTFALSVFAILLHTFFARVDILKRELKIYILLIFVVAFFVLALWFQSKNQISNPLQTEENVDRIDTNINVSLRKTFYDYPYLYLNSFL